MVVTERAMAQPLTVTKLALLNTIMSASNSSLGTATTLLRTSTNSSRTPRACKGLPNISVSSLHYSERDMIPESPEGR